MDLAGVHEIFRPKGGPDIQVVRLRVGKGRPLNRLTEVGVNGGSDRVCDGRGERRCAEGAVGVAPHTTDFGVDAHIQRLVRGQRARDRVRGLLQLARVDEVLCADRRADVEKVRLDIRDARPLDRLRDVGASHTAGRSRDRCRQRRRAECAVGVAPDAADLGVDPQIQRLIRGQLACHQIRRRLNLAGAH